jgi:hypothetical protein
VAEVSTTQPAPTAAPSKPIVKLAPCKPPAVRDGKACVTDVVETVVLPAPSSGSAGAPASTGFAPSGDDDDHVDDDYESDDEDHGDDDHGDEDHGDDDHGDDDHEDDDHEDDDHEDEGHDD